MRRICMFVFLQWIVTGAPVAVADVGIISIGKKHAEIRWAAFVHTNQQREITLRLCSDPIRQWESRCESTPLQSPPLAETEWTERQKRFLQIESLQTGDEALQAKRDAIRWTRDRIRDKLNDGSLTEAGKGASESALRSMVASADPEARSVLLKANKSILDQWTQWISHPGTELAATLLSTTEAPAIEAALAPVANWIFHSVCRCELAPAPEPSEPVQCVLARGDTTLARSTATVGDCDSRASCGTQTWNLDFRTLIESECRGFYSVGSLVPKLSVGGTGKQETEE